VCQLSIYNSFPVIRTTIEKKIVVFTYSRLHCLFALGSPLWQSRKTLHEWKDNSVLAKPVAACTHLFLTLSQLFEPQVQKIAIFTYRSPHFCLPWRRPGGNYAICCMDGKASQCLTNASQHVPIYLQQFPSNSNRKCKKSPFSRTAAHIFVSSGDAPATITQYVAWMERQFNACQTPRSMYLSILNSFRVIQCLSQCVSPKIAIFYHIFVSPGYAPGAITLNVVWTEREFDV